jgi:hypothetical protein
VHPDVLIYILPLFAKTKPLLVHLDVLNIVTILNSIYLFNLLKILFKF